MSYTEGCCRFKSVCNVDPKTYMENTSICTEFTQHLLKLKIYTFGKQNMVQCLVLLLGSSCSDSVLRMCHYSICPSRHPPERKCMQIIDHAVRSLGCLSIWSEGGCSDYILPKTLNFQLLQFLHIFIAFLVCMFHFYLYFLFIL